MWDQLTHVSTSEGAQALSQARPRPQRKRKEGPGLGYLMVTPSLLMICLLILLPLLYSVYLSLFDWKILQMNGPKAWAGIGNYLRMLRDSELAGALGNTILFVVSAVSVELVLGFIIALALFNINEGRKLANAIILLPMIITPVITALLWRYLLDPQFGVVAQLMTLAGSDGGVAVWGSTTLALPGLVLVDIWQWTPFVILVLHAGMLSISSEQFEAAAIDGAGQFRIAWNVILPAIMPQVLLVLLFRTMDTYRIFDTVFVLTRGGPQNASQTIGFYTYKTGFSYTEMGYAMALSLLILVTVAIISSFYIRLLRRGGVL